MKSLEEKRKSLQLTEDEHKEILFDEEKVIEANKRGECSIIGKIQAERIINKEVLRSTLVKIWKTSKIFTVINIRPNLFLIKFESHSNKKRVLQNRPWLFSSFLFVLKQLNGCIPPSKMNFNTKVFWVHMHILPITCMNAKLGSQIGKNIGNVTKYDVRDDGTGWENVL